MGKTTYDRSLDGLRAVAVSLVVASHTIPACSGGWLGVDIFFVLSGFLITRLLVAEMDDAGRMNLFNFYMRRVLRLFPAFGILLATYVAFAFLVASNTLDHLKAAFWASTYLMSWVAGLERGQSGFMLHTWSLSVEEQFYILWPAILIFIPRKARVPMAVVLAVMSAFWRYGLGYGFGASFQRLYFAFDVRAESLLVGCIIALMPTAFRKGGPIGRGALALSPMLIATVSALTNYGHETDRIMDTLGFTLTAILSAGLLIAAREDGWLNRVLSLPPLAYIGRISYGIYLWHYPILAYVRPHAPLATAACVVATVGISVLSFELVERRVLALKRYFPPARVSDVETAPVLAAA
jgi:peptidoglycan/LPS O-acetylase OafA/YrhL